MKSRTYAARNVHVMVIMAYLFVPMLVITPAEKSANPSLIPEPVALGGIGGSGWVPVEEPQEEVLVENQIEALFLSQYEGVAFTTPKMAFYTGQGAHPDIRRVNWMKVAETSLPVTRNITSSTFGWRPPPCNGCSSDHNGVDFVPGAGTPVLASMDGVVVDRNYNGSFGEYITLEHVVPVGDEVQRWETVYAHLERDSIPVEVQVGSIVERKQVIGRVGNTGQSTGPHLHFEIRIDGVAVDPIPLLGDYQVIRVTLPVGSEIPGHLVANEGVRYEVTYE